VDSLPDGQQHDITAEALRTIVDSISSSFKTIEQPRGFGRD
jgi:hypothetical protein